MPLETVVSQVASLREQLELAQLTEHGLEDVVYATPEYMSLMQQQVLVRELQKQLSGAEALLRQAAIDTWLETSEVQAHPAVRVKFYTTYTYDAEKAKAYCITHDMPACLRLDAKAFEPAAAVLGLDFVRITKEPRATIATDLSEYLPAPAPEEVAVA